MTKIENLETLEKLSTLHLANNRLASVQDMEGLLKCPSLSVLDIQNNKIEDPKIIELLEQMPNLRVLYLMNNPVIKNIPNYRKTMIARIRTLTHLDDRPVFVEERRTAEAWFRGGLEEEKKERQKIDEEKEARDKRNWEAFSNLITQGRSEKERFAKYEDEEGEHKDIFDELEEKEIEELKLSESETFVTQKEVKEPIVTKIAKEEKFTRIEIIGEDEDEDEKTVAEPVSEKQNETVEKKVVSYEELD